MPQALLVPRNTATPIALQNCDFTRMGCFQNGFLWEYTTISRTFRYNVAQRKPEFENTFEEIEIFRKLDICVWLLQK